MNGINSVKNYECLFLVKQKTKKLKNGEKKFPGTPIYTYYFYYEIRP